MIRFLFCFFFLNWTQAFGQEIDSLQKAVAIESSSTKKAYLLFKISDYWSYRDTTKAIEYLSQANPLIENNTYLEALALFYKAGIYYDHDIEKSQSLYMQCERQLQPFNTTEAYHYKARLWHNYATLDQMQGNDKSFLAITLKYCIPYAEKAGEQELLSSYLSDVGMVFYNHKEYDKSIGYYRQAIDVLREKKGTSESLFRAYVNIAQSQVYKQDVEGALISITTANNMLKSLSNSRNVAFFYSVKSKYYRLVKDSEKALESINEGIEFAEKYHDDYDLLTLQYEKYELYKLQGDFLAAKAELVEILDDKKYEGLVKNRLALLIELAETETTLGNYKHAYELMDEYRLVSDSLHAENIKSQIANLETRYRTSEKEKEIINLQNKSRIEHMLMWSSIVFVLLLSCIFSYAMYQRRKRTEEHLYSLEQQREIDVSRALTEGEEQERLRLARDLHDGLGGMITGIKISLENKARLSKNADLLKTVTQLDTVVADLRRTARNLIPENLMKYGLEDALRDFCQSIQSDQLRISFYCNDLSGITNKNTQLILYRIMLELVNNALRHAEATEILLQCTREKNLLLIDVEDNGKGFDLHTTKRNMGLDNIERRVKYLEGKMNIDSQPGKGTIINIECQV